MITRGLTLRSGGEILADQLLLHGASLAFCVPGESYLALLDAFYDRRDRFTVVNARHEAGAAHMAEAYGKLTGKPGLCLVTRGPGASHAAVGVHTAAQDSTPMILIVGQVSRSAAGREAFQEIEYQGMFGGVAKWVTEVGDARRIPELVSSAFHMATSGRCGPVVMAIPEDVLSEAVEVPDASPYRPAQARLAEGDLKQLMSRLDVAERPVLLVGGGGWTDAAAAEITAFAERAELPVACSFRRQDIVDNASDSFCGELGTAGPTTLPGRVRDADLVVVVGARLGEITTQGYEILGVPRPAQGLAHIHAGAEELGRVYAPDLSIVACPVSVAAALSHATPHVPAGRAAWRAMLRGEYLDTLEPPVDGQQLNLGAVIVALRRFLPDDAIITLDAGNHTGWPQRFYRFGRPGRELGSTSGAMGYSVPAAVAAAILTDRTVVSCVGDGGFMMSGFEVATAAQYGAAPIILLFNNGMYGTIRMHQEREFPGRVIATDLPSIDFVQTARGLGAYAERVTETEEFEGALERARAAGRVAVLELVCDPLQITTRSRLHEGGAQ